MAENMVLKGLEEKARKAYQGGHDIMERAKAETRALTDEEKKSVDAFLDEYEGHKKDMDRYKRDEEAARFLNDPVRKTAIGMDNPGLGGPEDEAAIAKKLYNAGFRKALRKTQQHGHARELMTEAEYKALSSISAMDGGLAVSEEWRGEMIQKLRDRVQVMGRATVIQTDKAAIGFPSFDYDGEVDRVLEGEQIGEEDITDILGKESFNPTKRARIFKVPVELVEDQDFNLINLLTTHFGVRFGEIMENDFFVGDGVNKTLGILKAPISVRRVTGSGNAEVKPEDIIDLAYDIRAVYRGQGSYSMHRNTLRQVRKLRDLSSGAGTGMFLWQPSFQAGQPATVNGFPVMESEFFTDYNASGTTDDPLMLFGDWSYYWIVMRKAFGIQVLDQLYAAEDKVGYKLRARYDGAPIMLEPFKILGRKG